MKMGFLVGVICLAVGFLALVYQETEQRQLYNEAVEFCQIWTSKIGEPIDCSAWADDSLLQYGDAIEWCFNEAPIATLDTFACVYGVMG